MFAGNFKDSLDVRPSTFGGYFAALTFLVGIIDGWKVRLYV